MSKVSAPRSVRMMRFTSRPRDIESESHKVKGLEYLLHSIERVVVSEKYILERDLLVLDVRPETDKLKMKLALESVSNGNKVRRIRSSNRKPTLRVFRGKRGSTSASKRMYVLFSGPFNFDDLTGGES